MTTTPSTINSEAGVIPVSAELAIAARRLEQRSFSATGKHRECLLTIVDTLRRLARACRQVED